MSLPQPSWFISHGAPNQILMEDNYSEKLRQLGRRLPVPPRVIVIVSAHGPSASDSIQVTMDVKHALEYDFRGFQPEMYQVQYPCSGSPEVAGLIVQHLSAEGLVVEAIKGRRLDHGVWVPLKLIFPDASIPVVQIFLPSHAMGDAQNSALFLRVGKALANLRKDGVLIMGSGGAVHNLRKLQWSGKDVGPPMWAVEFEAWLRAHLEARDVSAIASFQEEAPHADEAHPTIEHFTPLLFAIGATLQGDTLDWLYEGYQYGSLSMLCVGFTQPEVASGSNLPN